MTTMTVMFSEFIVVTTEVTAMEFSKFAVMEAATMVSPKMATP